MKTKWHQKTCRNYIYTVTSTVTLAMALVFAANLASAQSVYPPASQLAAKWWQWILETPAAENPLTDATGEFGAVNQPNGNVWFLAGNTSGGSTVRIVTIPEGKALFFPIANVFDVEDGTATAGGGKVFSVKNPLQTAQNLCSAIIATAFGLSCSVDGTSVPITSANLEQSSPFAVQLPADNFLGVPGGVYYPMVDSGYYLLVRPLSPGQHTIHFAGSIAYFSVS